MRALLDNRVPHALRNALPGHEGVTAKYLGWHTLTHGALPSAAAAAGFGILPRVDQGILRQESPRLPLAVIIVFARSNRRADLAPFCPRVLEALEKLQPKMVVELR